MLFIIILCYSDKIKDALSRSSVSIVKIWKGTISMRREKFSPTIEQNGSFLTKMRNGLSKKAAALLPTGSATLGDTACDSGNENTPVSSEASVSVEATEQNNHQYGRVERQSHPDLSPDALKITSQYGNIEQYPLPVNFYGTTPHNR